MIIRVQGSKQCCVQTSDRRDLVISYLLGLFSIVCLCGFLQVQATKPAEIACILTVSVKLAYTSYSTAAGISVE